MKYCACVVLLLLLTNTSAVAEEKFNCFTAEGDRVVFIIDENKIFRCNRKGKNCHEQVIAKQEKIGEENVLSTADGIHTRISHIDKQGVRLLSVAWRSNDPNWVSPNDPSIRDDLFFCGS